DLGAAFNEAGLATGEALQSVDESVHPLRLLGRDGERELLLIRARVRGAGDVEVGADALQRGAQFVSRVGCEAARREERLLTGGDRAVEACEHSVELPGERSDLGRLSGRLDANAEVFGIADARRLTCQDF